MRIVNIFMVLLLSYVMTHAGGDKKALVLLDSWMTMESHSLFFSQISAKGYEVEYKLIDSTDYKILVYD